MRKGVIENILDLALKINNNVEFNDYNSCIIVDEWKALKGIILFLI